jgi:hypothetical protein
MAAEHQQEETGAGVLGRVPPVDLVLFHLLIQVDVQLGRSGQRVGPAHTGAGEVADDPEAGAVVVGVVLLVPSHDLVDVVDDADVLVEQVGERELLLALGSVHGVVHRADEAAVFLQAERQDVRDQPLQDPALEAVERERDRAGIGEEARPDLAVVERLALRVDGIDLRLPVDHELVAVYLGLADLDRHREEPRGLAQERKWREGHSLVEGAERADDGHAGGWL